MVRALFFCLISALFLHASTLIDRVHSLMDEHTFITHKKLIGLLFEDRASFMHGDTIDMIKVATTLENNGLLNLQLPDTRDIEITFEYSGENPIFFMKIMEDTLENMGLSFFLTKEARLDENGFSWCVMFDARMVPDPVLIAKRLEKYHVFVSNFSRQDDLRWKYRINMQQAIMPAKTLKAGEILNIIRPVRPIWMNVSHIKHLNIRELPGSHWYADVVIYDKMLHILSLVQNDTRRRYLSLKLPQAATYVKISDRFTLENLKGGLKLNAQGEK